MLWYLLYITNDSCSEGNTQCWVLTPWSWLGIKMDWNGLTCVWKAILQWLIVFPDTRKLPVLQGEVDRNMSPGKQTSPQSTFHMWWEFLCIHVQKYLPQRGALAQDPGQRGGRWAWGHRKAELVLVADGWHKMDHVDLLEVPTKRANA